MLAPVESVTLESVRVGTPSELARTTDGDVVWSSIVKQPVTTPTIRLDPINLAGDDQSDRTVHGGVDKAVYAYSADHFPAWSTELGHPVESGAFGENLTITGATEADVAIGDRWQWGDAVLEVTQPRWPCFKLTLHSGVRDIGARMRASGRTGWYLRVITPGTPPTSGEITVARHHPARVTVLDAHLAASDRKQTDPARTARVAGVTELAEEWRGLPGPRVELAHVGVRARERVGVEARRVREVGLEHDAVLADRAHERREVRALEPDRGVHLALEVLRRRQGQPLLE